MEESGARRSLGRSGRLVQVLVTACWECCKKHSAKGKKKHSSSEVKGLEKAASEREGGGGNVGAEVGGAT